MEKRYLHGKYSSGQLCLMAVFIAIGLVLQYIEGTFAIFAPPGAKIGLANVVSIISLFMFGGANAFVIAVIRAVTGSLLGSGAAAVAYSTAGAAAAVVAMWFCRKKFFPSLGIIGISIVGAAAHNLAQVAVAAVTLQSAYVFSYLPAVLIFALCGGLATGYTAAFAFARIAALKKYTVKNIS